MITSWKRPPSLRKGQCIALVAPAGKIAPIAIQQAIGMIEEWGLQVQPGQHLFAEASQFAGTDAQRQADLQAALDDSAIHAIICARGGYGTTRFVDHLDFTTFLRQPKWLIGYSDITTLHEQLHQLGVESLHATMPLLFDRDTPLSIGSLRNVLFGGEIAYTVAPHSLNRPGEAEGPLIGGNLALLASNTGTASDIDTTGKILFIEDIHEYLYNIDRMLIQLKRSGKLDQLAGLLVGHFTDSKDNEIPFGKTPFEIVAEAVQEYSYPVCYGFPVGHEPENLAMPCGRKAHLQVGPDQVKLWTAGCI